MFSHAEYDDDEIGEDIKMAIALSLQAGGGGNNASSYTHGDAKNDTEMEA